MRSTPFLNFALESTAPSLLIIGSDTSAGWAVLCLYSPLKFLVNSNSHLAATDAVDTTESLAPAGSPDGLSPDHCSLFAGALSYHCNTAPPLLLLPHVQGSPGTAMPTA